MYVHASSCPLPKALFLKKITERKRNNINIGGIEKS